MDLPYLKAWRMRAAISQRDLAAASGTGASTIVQLERGERRARPLTVRRLAAALGIRPDQLQGPPPQPGEPAGEPRTEG
jgi:transcriptional regulator with XRE-family HTH domain